MPGLFGGSSQPGFVPSAFDPDDPLAQQKAMADALRQPQQPQEESNIFKDIAGSGANSELLSALFPALGFAQKNLPQAAILRALLGGGGAGGQSSGGGGGMMGGLGAGFGGLGGFLGG